MRDDAPDAGSVLDLHSTFLTVQGEGPFSGHRAVFVRLAGCNLRCPGCDTEYTQGRRAASIHDIAGRVSALAEGTSAVVVITGGEPLRQPIGRLCHLLYTMGFRVQIESNGTVPPDDRLHTMLLSVPQMATLVVSPKTKKIHPNCHTLATAFKYVVDHRTVALEVPPYDGLPLVALEHEQGAGVARPRDGAPVYLTPYDVPSGEEQVAESGHTHGHLNRVAVAESCIRHEHVAQVQLHKMLGVA